MADTIDLKISGFKNLNRMFNRMPVKFQQNTLRKAVTFALTPALNAARQEAPKDYGGLEKSLRKRVRTNRQRGIVRGIIGPNPKFQFSSDAAQVKKPYRYLPLVTRGTIYIEPNRFVDRAFTRVYREMIHRFVRKAKRDIPKDLARLRQKGVVS